MLSSARHLAQALNGPHVCSCLHSECVPRPQCAQLKLPGLAAKVSEFDLRTPVCPCPCSSTKRGGAQPAGTAEASLIQTLPRHQLCAPPCAQLYNEEVNDLLAPEGARLVIHESREAGVYVAGLREEIVTSCEHVLQLLEAGERARHTGETRMNKASSRSHAIFRMVRAPCLSSSGQDFRVWMKTERTRHTDETRMNRAPLRSHSIFAWCAPWLSA